MREQEQVAGILRITPAQFVGEGRGVVVLTPDAVARRDALAAQEPVVIESNLPDSMSGKEIRAKAKELYPSGQTFTNQATGRIIEMISRARGELASHGANLRTLKIMPHLKELVENAIPLFENTGDGKHWHHYGAAAVIDGEAFFVRLIAHEGSNGKLQLDVFYDAQVSPREIIEGTSSPGRSLITNEDARSRSPSKELLVQWWELVKSQEQAAQQAGDNAAEDVGASTAAGLSKQAGQVLERTQRKGVLGMPAPEQQGTAQDTIPLTTDASERLEALQKQEPVVIESGLPESLTDEEKRQVAERDYPLNEEFTNRATGKRIRMVKRARGELTFHSANLRTLKIMPHLKELVEQATPLYQNTGKGKTWHSYGVAATIDGEAFLIRLVAYENVNGQLDLDIFYDAQVSPRKKVEELSSPSRSSTTNGDARSRGSSEDKLVTWWRKVKEQEQALQERRSALGMPAPEQQAHTQDTTRASDPLRAVERATGGRAVYEAQKAAGKTELGYNQWLQVRTPEFKAWFGDWEQLRAEKQLDAMEPVKVPVPDEWRSMDTKAMRAEMVTRLEALLPDEEANRLATPVVHPELGEIFVNREGIKKTKNASADSAKILVAANIQEVLPKAIYSHSEPLNKPKKDKRLEGYVRLYAKVVVDGVPLTAVFTVERKTDGKWYYNTVMRLASEDEKTREFQIGGVTDSSVQVSPLAGLAEWKREAFERVNPESVSKAVNPKTGEPLVVYHGTQRDFNIFDESKRFRFDSSGGGLYFTSDPSHAGVYADSIENSIADWNPNSKFAKPVRAGASIYSVYVRLANPLAYSGSDRTTMEDAFDNDGGRLIHQAREQGHDGVIFTRSDGYYIGVVAFSPEQVKSAIGNRGTFDGKNPDILASPLGLGYKNAQTTSLTGEAGALDQTGGKPVSSKAVLDSLGAVIEAVGRDARALNRAGRFHPARKSIGFFHPSTWVTRIKTANDVPTALHELAHALDDALWGHWDHWKQNALGLSEGARGELRKLGVDLYGKKPPPNGFLSEGFAEFGRLWFADREQARAKAPEFTRFFEGELAKRPKLAKAIEAASALATAYFRQGAKARAGANIARLPTRTQNALQAAKSQATDFRKNWIEAAAAIEELSATAAKLRGDPDGTLPTELDPMASLRFGRLGADAVAEVMALEGMIDAGRNLTGARPLIGVSLASGEWGRWRARRGTGSLRAKSLRKRSILSREFCAMPVCIVVLGFVPKLARKRGEIQQFTTRFASGNGTVL